VNRFKNIFFKPPSIDIDQNKCLLYYLILISNIEYKKLKKSEIANKGNKNAEFSN